MDRQSDAGIIEFGRFKLLPNRRELFADGRPIALGARAFDVLMALIDARGQVLSKDDLINFVWPGKVAEDSALQVQISALRKALAAGRDLIRTVAGRGYQFTGEVYAAGSNAAQHAPQTNLAQTLSELIGREADLLEVTTQMSANRMVTL